MKNEVPDEEIKPQISNQENGCDDGFIAQTLSPYQDYESLEESEVPKPKNSRKRKDFSEKYDNEKSCKKIRHEVTDEEIDILKVHADLKCEKCSQELNDWKQIKSHYRQIHKIAGYLRCCGKKLDRANEIKDHASVSSVRK